MRRPLYQLFCQVRQGKEVWHKGLPNHGMMQPDVRSHHLFPFMQIMEEFLRICTGLFGHRAAENS